MHKTSLQSDRVLPNDDLVLNQARRQKSFAGPSAKKIAQSEKFDAIIAIGAVIRGGTPHFDFVAGECNKGLASVSLDYGIPVSFGVITTDSIEQAIERSGTKAGNKGGEAALGALEMVNVMAQL